MGPVKSKEFVVVYRLVAFRRAFGRFILGSLHLEVLLGDQQHGALKSRLTARTCR